MLPLIAAGKVKVFALLGPQRVKAYPDIPVVAGPIRAIDPHGALSMTSW